MTNYQHPLEPGERLLWSGAPRQGIVFRAPDLFIVPFSLLWGGFALTWNVGAWTANTPIFFRLFGLPFLAVGAWLAIGRFLVDARRRAHTRYGVTTRRVIISTGARTPTITSLGHETLSDVSLAEKPDRTGTIAFGPGGAAASPILSIGLPGMPAIPVFESIADAARVYAIIQEAKAGIAPGATLPAPATPASTAAPR